MVTFIALFLIFYMWHGLGITVGYHRLLAHRALRCNKVLEYFLVLGGYLAFQGPPIWWVSIHRAHHRFVDTELDPHTPLRGRWYAFLGWLVDEKHISRRNLGSACKDLLNDKVYKALEPKNTIWNGKVLTVVINIGFRVALLAVFGWTIFWADTLAATAVFFIPQLLNCFCHIPNLGYKNFASEDDGVNVWWVGILALGEGWHNNHHAYPGSSRTGLRAHEFDISWHFIRLMKALGLVEYANEPEKMLRILKNRKPGAEARLRRIKERATVQQRMASVL